MAQRARFITLEGGEGAGKSTQARLLVTRLEAAHIPCVITREPGGSPGAEEIRKLLVEGAPGRWDALTETLLMFAARTDHVGHTIAPALHAGKWVVCDRFTDSTYAYQGAGRGIDTATIAAIERATMKGFGPHLTLILDISPAIGLARAQARRGGENRFEQFDLEFHERLRVRFRDIATANPKRCAILDASGNEAEIADRIWHTIQQRLEV